MDNSSELREIEQQRIRILSSIRAIRRQSSTQSSPSDAKTNNGNSANESQKLQNLYEQYAKLLQKRGALQRRKLHDPLTSLPAELWQECLSYVASEEKGPDQVLTLLLVSKTWRQTLLRVPALWSTIVLDDNPDVLHRLSACIFLSGTLPLTVRIQLPPKSPFIDADADPPSIIPNTAYTTLLEPETRKRIKRIVFTQSAASQRAHKQGDDGPFIAFYDTAFSLLKPFEDLETLEEVRMQHEFDYYSRTLLEPGFPIAPKLRGVWRWCLPGVTLERMMRDLDANNGFYYKFVSEQEENDEKPAPGPIYSGMSELRHLSTNMTVESACQLLPKLPSLQHLMLTSPHARDQFPFTEPSSYTDPTLLGTLASTRLTMLECSQLIAPAHHPLFHLPSLTVLCLDLTWPSLSSFLGSFSVLPNLKRLELGMKESDELAHGSSQEKSGGFVLPSVLPDLSSVQTLILQNYDTDYWPLGDDGSDSVSSNSDAEDDNSRLNGTESPNASSSPTSTGYRRAHTSSPVPPPRRPASPMFAQLLFACRSMLCGVQDLTLTFRIRVSIWPVLSYLSSLANVLERICVSGMLSTSKRKALLASRNIPHAYRPTNGSSQSSFPTCVPLPTLKELTAFTSSILNFIDAPNLQTLHCPDPIPPAVPSMYFNGLKPLSVPNHNAKKFATREPSAPALSSSSQPPHSLKRTSKAKRRPRHVQLRAGPLLNKAILHPAQAPLLSVVNTTNLRILYWVGGNEEIRAVPQIDWEEEDRPTAVQQPSTSTSHADAGNTENKDETTEPERKYGGKGQEASIFPPGVAVQSLRIASLHDIKFGSEAIMPEVLRFLEGLGRVESKHEEDEDEEDGQRSRCRWPCPELETIAFGGYPAFDLLLRVLESRNMWCGETTENEDRIVGQMGVGDSKLRSIKGKGKAKELSTGCGPKRITKILLPGYPAPDTLSSIVRFLGQRLTMPDDGDGVSFSYDERYFREDVRGCHYCFASGWRCRTAVHSKIFSFVEDAMEDVNAVAGAVSAINNADANHAGANDAHEEAPTAALDLAVEETTQGDTSAGEALNISSSTPPLEEPAQQGQAVDTPVINPPLAETNEDPLSRQDNVSSLRTPPSGGWESPRFGRSISDDASLSNGTDHFDDSLGEAEESKKYQASPNGEERSETAEAKIRRPPQPSPSSSNIAVKGRKDPSPATASTEVKAKPPVISELPYGDHANKAGEKAALKKDEPDWMSSWWKTYDANERRFREWTSKYFREGYCLRHDPENLVEITEETLSGVKGDWWDSYEFEGEGKDDVDPA